MGTDTFAAVVAFMLAVSLATERLVVIAKTVVPWLSEESTLPSGDTDRRRDRPRRLIVQGIAFGCAWVTSAFLAGGIPAGFLGSVEMAGITLPTVVVALLASGGSALWTSLVGYTSAIKDIRASENRDRKAAAAASARAAAPAPGASGGKPVRAQ